MTRIFVYGTLLAGEPNHRLLARATFVGPAVTEAVFSLVDLGPFPALVAGGVGAVSGEVYEVDAPTLARLDILEGHPRLYRRTRIALEGGATAQSYLLALEQVAGRPVIGSGSWRARQGAES
jgi:gamma-glutamylcyclotransferase (GGCT)/AIG2-like uncharacterized protein YtfP